MEDYKKKYEDALENLKSIKAANKDNKLLVDFIEYKYPELKESEDDRIRKALIHYFNEQDGILTAIDGNVGVRDILTWLEKLGEQKPTDEVETKFKVGDWCINNEDNTTFQITKVLSNLYYYRTNEGKEYSCTRDSIERDAHLWTIQDAKDGDVLAVGDMIFIYKRTLASHIVSYCKLFNKFFESFKDIRTCSEGNSNVHPSTKEQRDLLFSKMKEAGYEWDAEKKELRKMSIKFTEKYKTCDWLRIMGTIGLTKEHIKRLNNAINILESLHEYTDAKYLKEIKDKLLEDTPNIEKINNDDFKELKKIKQKPAWSEEDEHNLNSVINLVNNTRDGAWGSCIGERIEFWLKSIKERMKGE